MFVRCLRFSVKAFFSHYIIVHFTVTHFQLPFLITSAKKYSKFANSRQIVIFAVASSNFVLERKETLSYTGCKVGEFLGFFPAVGLFVREYIVFYKTFFFLEQGATSIFCLFILFLCMFSVNTFLSFKFLRTTFMSLLFVYITNKVLCLTLFRELCLGQYCVFQNRREF